MAIELTSQFIFWGAALALLAVVASVISRRLGAPLLLVFLVLGMLAGEDGPGGVSFNDTGLAFLFGNLALAIIIFDGGLGARISTFRVSLSPALTLATFGVVITAGITGAAAYWILPISWQEALLIGAIVGSTDAAAVFGLLRMAGLELKERTSATLEIESGTNDPMAIFLTITLVQLLAVGNDNPGWSMLTEFIRQMGLGLALGFSGGFTLTWLLKRLSLPASLYPLMALAAGLTLFGLTNMWGGSGFLAIYIVGVMVGNASLPYGNDIHRFHDGIAWLSQIGMFLMLGMLVTPSHLLPLIAPAVAIAMVLIFVARPVAVLISLLPFYFPWREQIFIGWCGLRGAVPIILALFPSLAGLEQSTLYFELAFFVVLISLVLQGWTIAPMARWLRIELPPSLISPKHHALMIANAQEKELMVFETVATCSAVGMIAKQLPVSHGAQVVGIIRQGVFVEQWRDQNLQADDHVVILSSTGHTNALDRLFALSEPPDLMKTSEFFGEFVIKPDAKLSDLSQVYRFELPEKVRDMTVADFIGQQFHGKPVVGDRVKLGHVQFVVREFSGDHIKAVGLKLERS